MSIPVTDDNTAQAAPHEDAGLDQALLPVRHRMPLMYAIMAVSICQFLDATIATVALPHMRTSLGASVDSVSWVLTSFIMAGAIVTPITGWLSDRFGSRRLFLFATISFLVASALCGAATSLVAMVAFRSLQGAASALMGPLSQTVIFDINPPSKQSRAIALWGTVSMVAPISGPFLGGFLTDYLNWRWVYYVNLPIGIPAILALWFLLPSRPLVARQLDKISFASIALGLGSLQLALDRGQGADWLHSWEIIIEGAIAVSCLWIFVTRSVFITRPLFNRALFRNTYFIAGIVFMIMLGMANVALSATLPTMYQNIYGYSVITTGLLMAPRGIGLVLTMLLPQSVTGRIDFRVLICCGFMLLAFALRMMAHWSLDMEPSHIVVAGLIQGVGLGMIFTPINMLAFGSLDASLRTDGSSLMGLFRNLGGSFGISFIVTFLARNTQVSHADLASHITSSSLPVIDIGTLAGIGQDNAGMVMAMVDGEVNRQAMMISYIDTFYVLSWALLAFSPLPFLLRKKKPAAAVLAGAERDMASH